MGGCAAVNCTNHSRKGFRMFRFPTNVERKKKWIINCRRDNWEPGPQSQLCIVHFEESQFENNRQDEKKKLKQDAIPTLFNVPNKPQLLTEKRQKGIGCPKPGSLLEKFQQEKENIEMSPSTLKKKIEMLEKENEALKRAALAKDNKLSAFLSCEQITALDKQAVAHWSNESIIKGLKLRFALGKQGYCYLRGTGYPLPSYSTLNRRIQHIKLDFGILKMLFSLLKTKVDALDIQDRNCCLLLDEMEIANFQDFDISSKCFVGNTTLGKVGVASHYLVVMLRGLKSKWKQVVAHELTGASTSGSEMKKLICEVINAAREIGLNIKAVTSDMGPNNKAMWVSLGTGVKRNERQTNFTLGNDEEVIHTFADVPHLLKNLRKAFLSRVIILPPSVSKEHDLPGQHISSGYVKQLWIDETKSESSLRSLYHLSKIHLFPNQYNAMNVATAVQLFSVKTAAALEKAVSMRQIDKASLTTAWFIRFVDQWFSLMSARHRKVGITQRNKEDKLQFLNYFITVIQETKFGDCWKPLQTGIIMSTLSSTINLTIELLSSGLTFFLPGRLTQDALENVFSQVRRKSGKKPTALEAKRALKLICLSQFISDIKNSSYASDSDFHLLDPISVSFELPELTENCEIFTSLEEQSVDSPLPLGEPSTSKQHTSSPAVEENDIYYIAGSILNSILSRKSICIGCTSSIKEAKDLAEPSVPRYRTLLTEYSNMGGLKKPESGLYRICREAERAFKQYKNELLSSQFSIDDALIENIKNECENVILPTCCKLKEYIINYYLITRCQGLKKHMLNKKAHEACFTTASASKKQKVK